MNDKRLVLMSEHRSARLDEALESSDSLNDIFGEDLKSISPLNLQQISVDKIAFGQYQTRELSNENELDNLATSIREQGVLQPILVRPLESENLEVEYEVIAGERRLRAARLAGLEEIPALVRESSNRDTLISAIIENAQREDLNPIEEAKSYMRLLSEFNLNQGEAAELIGKARTTISNALRLLKLQPKIIDLISDGTLSAGHGKALLMLEDEKLRWRLAKKAAENQISVRSLEKVISRYLQEEEEIDEEYEREIKRLNRQSNKITDLLGLEDAKMHFDSQGRRRLNLVFPSEASFKRFMAKIK